MCEFFRQRQNIIPPPASLVGITERDLESRKKLETKRKQKVSADIYADVSSYIK